MNQVLNEVVKALTALVATVVSVGTPVVLTWLRSHLKTKNQQALLNGVQQFADYAVNAVEGGALDNAGKKAKAVQLVQTWLANQGKNADPELISGVIESAVAGMRLAWAGQPTTAVPAA